VYLISLLECRAVCSFVLSSLFAFHVVTADEQQMTDPAPWNTKYFTKFISEATIDRKIKSKSNQKYGKYYYSLWYPSVLCTRSHVSANCEHPCTLEGILMSQCLTSERLNWQVFCLSLCWGINYFEAILWFSSVPPDIFQDKSLIQTTPTSFCILYYSSFINYPITICHTV
jgi:hypothetical protein